MLYKYELLLIMYTCFKVMKVLFGQEQTISIWLRVGCYNWY